MEAEKEHPHPNRHEDKVDGEGVVEPWRREGRVLGQEEREPAKVHARCDDSDAELDSVHVVKFVLAVVGLVAHVDEAMAANGVQHQCDRGPGPVRHAGVPAVSKG